MSAVSSALDRCCPAPVTTIYLLKLVPSCVNVGGCVVRIR
jgi:hypothetical protein